MWWVSTSISHETSSFFPQTAAWQREDTHFVLHLTTEIFLNMSSYENLKLFGDTTHSVKGLMQLEVTIHSSVNLHNPGA
jgi:hypothetical protein